jgi:hypothetical protein
MRKLKTLLLIPALIVSASLSAAADSALLNLLPPDAQVIFGIHVEQSRYSPFGQFLLAKAEKEDGDLREFIAVTGFDPRRDITELVGASRGAGKFGVVCVRGRFDMARIVSAAQAKEGATEQYQGATVIFGPGKKPHGVAFLDSTLAVAGDVDSVRAAIDRWRNGGALNPETAARVMETAGRYDAWIVTAVSPVELAGKIPDDTVSSTMQGDVIRAIEQMSGGVKFGADVTIAGESVLKTDKDAAALADVIRFMVSLAQFHGNAEAQARFGEYARRLDLAAEGNRVKLSLVIPEAEFEKLFQSLEKRPARRRPAD